MPPKKRTLPPSDLVVSDLVHARPSSPKRRIRQRTYNPTFHSLSTLPYHVLTTIFSHLPSTTPPSFLLSLATLCRTLHDPAISVLYASPRLAPPSRAHKLLATLRARPELGVKVRRLEIGVEPLLTIKLSSVAWNLEEMIGLATGLQALRFTHPERLPMTRWRYPDGLWDALEKSGGRMQAWSWNRRYVPNGADLKAISERCFGGVRSLEMLDFDEEEEEEVTRALVAMPRVDDLSFIDCSAIMAGSLELMPAGIRLRELCFINCPRLTAEDLATFLLMPACAGLTALSVLKCQSCSLAFTVALPAGLLRFEFDGHLRSYPYTSAEPEYESLLPSGCVPSWPSSLQTLDATSLRKWSSAECERFLSSVWEAVPGMISLRRLKIWSMLTDIDWRERSEFRERWIKRMGGVFAGAEVRFDAARPAENLYGEEDFVEKGRERGRGRRGGGGGVVVRGGGTARGRGSGAARGRGGARGGVRGRGAARGGRRGRGRGRGKTVVVVVRDVASSGDDEYVDEE